MPTKIAMLTSAGLVPASYTAASMSEAARMEPEGIYDVTRTYPGYQALLLEAHFDRLENSAQLEDIPLRLDRKAVRMAIRTLLSDSGYEVARLRLAISRARPDEVIITLEPYEEFGRQLDHLRSRGVWAATHAISRRNPRAKTNDWVHQRAAIRVQLPSEVYEVIIVNELGELLEGFSSNFYAVRGGSLYLAAGGVLPGIARRVLLEFAHHILPVVLRPARLHQLPNVEETFLTSSGRGVVPIVRIDDLTIGRGEPGSYTRELIAAYGDWVRTHLEPI